MKCGDVISNSQGVSHYSRVVKTGNWHQAREAEPKDFDFTTADKRSLHSSTYKHLGGFPDKTPITTYQDFCQQKKINHLELDKGMPMFTVEAIDSPLFDASYSDNEFPRHKFGFDRQQMETTYNADYVYPYPFTPKEPEDSNVDLRKSYKKCVSQFSNPGGYSRPGNNTWWDETGIYANTHLHRQTHRTDNLGGLNAQE